jgi:arabinose-5-phosphate isomerase
MKTVMESREKQSYDYFLQSVRTSMDAYLQCIDYDQIQKAAEIILQARANGGRVHVSGIGKPGHVAGYVASLFSSVGTPTYFLHGTEAVHGSCGQLVPGDVVIFISNSGETAEMRPTVLAVKDNGCTVIGVSGNPQSWLAGQSDVHLFAGVDREGGPLNRAPRMSVLAEMIVLQALSIVLQAHEDITPQQYVKWHPGGALGQLRSNEK